MKENAVIVANNVRISSKVSRLRKRYRDDGGGGVLDWDTLFAVKKSKIDNVNFVGRAGLETERLSVHVSREACEYLSCLRYLRVDGEMVDMSTASEPTIRSLKERRIVNAYQAAAWIGYGRRASKASDRSKIRMPRAFEYFKGECVYRNDMFANYLEFPELRREKPTVGVTDVPPSVYLGEYNKFSIGRAYCEHMIVSYDEGKTANHEDDDCYMTTNQKAAEIFIGTLYRAAFDEPPSPSPS